MNRPIVHFEVPARDRHKLAEFYKDAFGWEMVHDDVMGYTTMATGNIGGGLTPSTPEQPAAVTFYIPSTDIDADIKKATEHGGQVAVPKMEVGDLGHIGFVMDPAGAVVGLMDFREGQGLPTRSSGREIVHIEINAGSDWKPSGDFYKNVFGWEIDYNEMMNYAQFKSGTVGGGLPHTGFPTRDQQVLPYVGSDDIDADLKQVEKLGGKVAAPKSEIPGYGMFAIFTDPEGHHLAFYQSTGG